MQERTGGSKTVVNGQITEVVTPTHHPEGDRSRDAQGRPRDTQGRVIASPAPAAEPAEVTAAPAEHGRRRRAEAGGTAAE